jgi:hypothetical protein
MEVEGAGGVYDCALDTGGEGGPVKGLKPTLISAIAIGLLAGSVVGVGAQEEEAAAEPSTPTKVAGTVAGRLKAVDFGQGATYTAVDGLVEVRGRFAEGFRFEMDDPRLTGPVTVAINKDLHNESEVWALGLRLENEAGSWSGQGTGVSPGFHPIVELNEVFTLDTFLLTGADAYEGLSAYLVVDGTEDSPTVEGVVFAGEMPPFPALPAE